MITNDRMAGSVPCWEKPSTAKGEIAGNLTYALHDSAESSSHALAYRAPETKAGPAAEPFGFGDLLDIVNPLQHIPVISSLYRGLTGDTIRGPGKVIGGALFGGFLGAGAGLVNIIAENETGQDVAGNALSMFSGEKNANPASHRAYTMAAYDAAKPRYNE